MTSQIRTQISNGLHWVQAELDKSLERARVLIEQHLENAEDSVPLQKALVEIHTVRGTATLIQCFGVAILAEEMKQVLLALMLRRIKEADAAYSALLGATVQLSDYIGTLATGDEDCVMVLQPLVNELRLARSKPILTEPELFALHLNALGLLLPMAPPQNPGAQDEAKKLIPHFQKALLSWLKNDADARPSIGRIGKIAEQIAERTVEIKLHQLWRIVAAIVESLLGDELDQMQDIKRLIGAVGQQIKLLSDSGEEAAIDKLGDLPQLLLFYIGRSQAQGQRAAALRKTYSLDTYLPSADQVEERRLRMRGPGALLLEHVADEVRKDLTRVKDNIDLVVRAGASSGEGLDDIRARLHRVASTLATLGLVPLQRVLENQVRLLETLGSDPDVNATWMNVATSILRVELGLEDALFRQVSHPDAGPAGLEQPIDLPHRRDLADSVDALLRESLINLARLKTAVDMYIREGEAIQALDAARMLDEIGAGLRILQSDRVAGLVEHLERYIRSPAFVQIRESSQRAERFADAIASIEYYIEAARDQLPEAAPILDGLERYVTQLELAEPEVTHLELSAPEAGSAVAIMEQPASVQAAPAIAADTIDPEIRDIFLEEAAEVLDTLRSAMPSLRRNMQDNGALAVVRRAFHTLKGSGRMVGAKQIGEFGWAVEKLLNRCLEGELTLDAAMLETIEQAVNLLPQLIERFRDGQLVEEAALLNIIERANNLAAGRPAEVQPEADINTVFREDSREKLALVDRWLEQQDPKAPDFAVDIDIVRAFHTLRGAAHVVNLPAVSELAMALETYLDSAHGADLRLPTSALNLIRETAQTLKTWVDAAGTTVVSKQDAAPSIARILELQNQVPEQAKQDAENRQLAEIFAGEAFDLVQKMDASLSAWAHSPAFRQAAADIRDDSHTLMGAALMSHCEAIANPARRLNQFMARMAANAPPPSPEFFQSMAQVLEQFYQTLDAYRERQIDHDGSELAARIMALDSGAQPAIEELTAPATSAQETVADETITEMPQVVEDTDANATALVAALAAADADDAELFEIFIGEARELLQSFDGYCAAWEGNPSGLESAHEIKRVLHTLKGSARVAGFNGIGDFSARLEALIAQATKFGAPDSLMFARLHQASDGLNRVLNDMQFGLAPDLASLMMDFETRPEPVSLLSSPPEPVAVPVAVSPAHAAADAAAEKIEQEDAELVGIFASEASELLESLQQAFGSWQREPRDLTGAREMQRALHTLKGGARMAGMNAIGSAAHDMETHINALELRGGADETSLLQLSVELENLSHMHDLLERGEYAPLRQEKYEAIKRTDIQPENRLAEAEVQPTATPQRSSLWEPLLFWKPEDDAVALAALRRETARVPVESLDTMLNQAGEISIYRSRLEEHNNAIQLQLNEMTQAIARVREQLRLMDIETDAQISARGMGQTGQQDRYADFDPLEMDRYTRMQELSRALAESVGDLSSLHGAMDGLASEAETLLLQQGRINTQVQQGLMGTLMVPFSRQVARLQRVVKQTAIENDKQADTTFSGIESELDRNVLERMTAPLEHLLRNSVVHGLETPSGRVAAGKPETGMVNVSLRREGTQLLIELSDDGRGLDFDAIRATAIKRGLMAQDAQLTDDEIAQFIFEPGFSTAKKLTHDAGRGIGMDVVASEVKQLGGTLELASEVGKGTRFLIRLPLNLAISQALLVEVNHEAFAIPLVSIEGIVRIAREQLDDLYREDGVLLSYGGHDYRVYHLGDFIGLPRSSEGETKTVSAILVRLGEGLGMQERHVAVVVDALQGNREIVSKAVGPLVSSVTGVSGSTILADGRVVLILDVPALALERTRRAALATGSKQHTSLDGADARNLIMVVDDSVTIRRVTERLLVKQGYRVITAKDGLDAMARLQTERPAAVLLDIEMPRADGFEVATFIRNNERIREVPVIMITSRSGDKHRERAMQIGVNRYLIKPFQEDDLLRELREVIEESI